MADLTVTASQIADAKPKYSEVFEGTLAEAVTAGQSVYLTSAGKYGVADADAEDKQQVRGIALQGGGAGETISILRKGWLFGVGVSGLAYDARVYLSDTAGALADAAGTMAVTIGRVVPLNDNPTFTKVLFVDVSYITQWEVSRP